MSRQNVFVLIVILALIGAGAYFALNNKTANKLTKTTTLPADTTQQPDTSNETSQPNDINAPAPKVITISMTDNGFSPQTLEISKGDAVEFKNDGSTLRWPASDPHPTHTGYPGFDAQRALEPGESWTFQFNNAGTWGYHDHLNPASRGTIIVK